MTEVVIVVDLDQVQELVLVETESRCYKCTEYDHFTKDCLTSKLEKGTEQIQQMYNTDEKQTSLKSISERHV